tara:strand:- start:200 stop:1189 length:990 start_codon:yes stop_codon:yes gene_type:complete
MINFSGKIAVIGGSGFVGRCLSKLLDKYSIDYDIFDLNQKDTKSIKYLDVTNINTFNSIEGYDLIINLAAEHKDNIEPKTRYDQVNVEGARNVCAAAERLNIKHIIFTSSVAVYGFVDENTDEQGGINYFNDYGRTKFQAENVYRDWFSKKSEDKKLTIIRPTVIFGKENRGNVYNLMKQIESKRFLMIGNGKNVKSMAYVENVAEFLLYALNFKEGYHLYNYVDKPDLNMNELVKIIRKKLFNKKSVGIRIPSFLGHLAGTISDFILGAFKIDSPISRIRIKKFISSTQFDTSLKETGFTPQKNLIEALNETLSHEFTTTKNKDSLKN